MTSDDALRDRCTSFHELCDTEWESYVSSGARATLEERKWNKPHRLPLTEDVRRLTEHLNDERRACLRALCRNPSTERWHALASVSLANVIMFNRRRSGEASRMLVSDFSNAANIDTVPADDVLEALSALEKKLLANFVRVEVRGKRGKKVPILLTANMSKEIGKLIELRSEVGVSDRNEFVFARPYFSSEDHMSGPKALSDAAKASGAVEPSFITGTNLRKHLATVCQILNLSEYELDQVCLYMGHNISVHREFYRLPQDTYQLAKVSRLLLCMEQGRTAEFQGKSISEIEVNPQFSDSEFEKQQPKRDTRCHQPPLANVDAASENERDVDHSGPQTKRCRRRQRESSTATVGNVEAASENERDVDHTRPRRKTCQRRQRESSTASVGNLEAASENEHDVDETVSQIEGRQGQRGSSGKAKKKRCYLSLAEAECIRSCFRKNIDCMTVPGKDDCQKMCDKHRVLQNLSWEKIKCTVRNEIEKRKRHLQSMGKCNL